MPETSAWLIRSGSMAAPTRVRDSDLSDVGVFADIGAAMREAQRLVDGRL